MLRIAWRSLWAHKLRTLLTALAIVLGVAMISGTYVLTDQIDAGFKRIFTDAYKGVDVTVQEKVDFSGHAAGGTKGLSESVLATVRGVDGVAVAHGYVMDPGRVAVRGKVVETGGAPVLFSCSSGDDLLPCDYVSGAAPARSGQVGIIEALANSQKLHVGSAMTVITSKGAERVRVSGVFRYASQSSLGGALLVNATLKDGQEWFNMRGRLSGVDVRAVAGVSREELRRRVRAALPPEAVVKTGTQAAADQTKEISDTIDAFLRPALLSFGGIAVLVGAFIIFNTFSMTVAQRRREFAMLRSLGAFRRQVLAVIAGEALVMGVFSSVLGLFAGLGLASGVNFALRRLAFDIPRGDPAIEPRTVVVALTIGIAVTLLSALVPAVRATRVSPVAVLQEGAELPPPRSAWLAPLAAALVAALGAGALLFGVYGSATMTQRLASVALGATLGFIAVALLSKYLIRPLVAVFGWPLRKLSPISGRLACINSARNPGRTAATAAALMIGIAVVVFVAVFAQSLKASFIGNWDRVWRADYSITATGQMALPASAVRRVEDASGVSDVTALEAQRVKTASGELAQIWGIDFAVFPKLWRFEWLEGPGDSVLHNFGAGDVLVEEQTAEEFGYALGERVTVTTSGGEKATLRVRGVYRSAILCEGLLIGKGRYAELFPRSAPFFVLAKRSPSADFDATKRGLADALADVPGVKVQTGAEYKEETLKQINQMLNLLYGLLALSVLISLFGIVNTLGLSVYERTREIGLLRAIGASRRQIRSSVRYESVITSVIGSLLGVGVGVGFAWLVVTRFAGNGIVFSVPGAQLVVFVVVGAFAGVLAALLPARRAARIDILDAIRHE